MAVALEQIHHVAAQSAELVHQPGGGAATVVPVRGQSTDARDGQKLVEQGELIVAGHMRRG
jgi:hypothetical protein